MSTVTAVAIPEIEQLNSQVFELAADIERLLRRSIQLDGELAAIGEAVRYGNVSRTAEVAAIHAEKAQAEDELRILRGQLNTARAHLAQRAEVERKQQLTQVITAIATAREEVTESVRTASIALGKFYDLQREATALINRGNSPAGGAWPHEVATLREANKFPTPYVGEWAGRHRDVIVDLDNCIRVRPVRPI